MLSNLIVQHIFLGSNNGYAVHRTPLLHPPLGLAIYGRNIGVAVIEALEHVATITCTWNY